ncbi:hypothetical protein XENTR_v10020413 [Xenopus tropicalis]|nr:hypothetical protein XENTR_v10020413 [Xenopus tropicalis]
MKNRSPSPPLHVHVDESTPVHVHIKKASRPPAKTQHIAKLKKKGGMGNLRRSATVKTKVPWIPPGKSSLRDASLKWEGLTHRLEITPPDTEKMFSALRLSDLSTDEEEMKLSKMNSYEEKIATLMSEMGTLKHELELQKREKYLGRCEEQLAASKRLLEAQQEELAEVSQELAETENENVRLKRNLDRIQEEKGLSIIQKQQLQEEKSHLLAKLLEAETDGTEAARQVALLSDTIQRLKHEKRMTSTDVNLLTRQKELLLQKLNTFEDTNRSLRVLLREQHRQETETYRLMEQKEMLLKKLSDSDTEKMHLQIKLHEQEEKVEDLLSQLKTEKDLSKTASEVSKSIEATKAHLHGQLRTREAENNRLSVQIRNLERNEAHQREEIAKLIEQLTELKEKVDSEKDALKKSVRAQKQRAERSEETLELLNRQLMDKDSELAKALSSTETWRSRYNKLMKESSQKEEEVAVLSTRLKGLLGESQGVEERGRLERESLLEKLHQQTTENTCLRMEHEKLKTSLTTIEEKLSLAQSEVQQLKNSLRQYEGLVDTYKEQLQKSRQEANNISLQLEMSEKESKNIKEEMNLELEQMRRKYQSRLSELEHLPEVLKSTELDLQECQQQLRLYEQKSSDLSSTISDLRIRMEQQGDKMGSTRERYQSAVEENKHLVMKLEELERRLEDASTQNRELLQVVAKREESIHQNQQRLDEKTHECASLARQLEAAIEDSRRQVRPLKELFLLPFYLLP